jgi:putative transposase
MRQPQDTLTRDHVHAHASALLQRQLRLRDYGRCCPVAVLLSVLFAACARLSSVSDTCRRLLGAPGDETIRQALVATLPAFAELQRRRHRALQGDLPQALRRRRQPIAIDVVLVPDHGQPQAREAEVYRGRARDGTRHFHAYASAYVSRKGRRYTVALTVVERGDLWDAVVRRLLRQAAKAGVRPKLVLLDRGFVNVRVVRYLQAARYPFLMLLPCRGKKPDPPGGPGGPQGLCYRRRSGWFCHTWADPKGQRATVSVCVQVTTRSRAQARQKPGRRGQAKPAGRPYAYWGWQPTSYAAVAEAYRRQFAIETTYRQLHQARIRTSRRSPLLRLFFVGLALVPRNVWVWVHYQFLAGRRRGGRVYHWGRLRFRVLLTWLLDLAEERFGVCDAAVAEVRVKLTTSGRLTPCPHFGNY